MNRPLIYLASPYSHHSRHVRRRRFLAACDATARLLERGHLVYSPIAASVPIVEEGGFNGTEWGDWKEFDEKMLSRCDELWVLMLPGWTESIGVKAEMNMAKDLRMSIRLVSGPEYSIEKGD